MMNFHFTSKKKGLVCKQKSILEIIVASSMCQFTTKRACSDIKKQINTTMVTMRASMKKKKGGLWGGGVYQKHKLGINQKGFGV